MQPVAHQTDIFSEREFQQWVVLLLESEGRRLRELAKIEREPQRLAGFCETLGNREKETQHEDER
jgi:hypothetical protein